MDGGRGSADTCAGSSHTEELGLFYNGFKHSVVLLCNLGWNLGQGGLYAMEVVHNPVSYLSHQLMYESQNSAHSWRTIHRLRGLHATRCSCCTIHRIRGLHATRCSCCTIHRIRGLHATRCSCCTIHRIRGLHATRCSCCTIHRIRGLHATRCSCCTIHIPYSICTLCIYKYSTVGSVTG